MHCVFSTKERRPLIKPELQARLWPYLGGIARENRMKALVVGGVEDHVHILLSIPSALSVAKALQLLKGNSSKWIHETFKEHRDFEWQEGYGGSASVFRAWTIRSNTLKGSVNTTGHQHFAKKSKFS
jgi:REP element-mobilizing transposase RayT